MKAGGRLDRKSTYKGPEVAMCPMSSKKREARRRQDNREDRRPGLTQAGLSGFMETEHGGLGCRKRRKQHISGIWLTLWVHAMVDGKLVNGGHHRRG